MSEFKKIVGYFNKMGLLRQMLLVFAVLLLFIILVEQPGSEASKRSKQIKYLIPRLIIEEVQTISIAHPASDEMDVNLSRESGKWIVVNGHSFPADNEKIDSFLKQLYAMRELEIVSKNPERVELFGVDEAVGLRVQIKDDRERLIGDFYAGRPTDSHRQYVRKSDSDHVIHADNSIADFLTIDKDGWKDKLLLDVDENEVKRIALKTPVQEQIMERKLEDWTIVSPVQYQPDLFTVRTFFEQLKKVHGTGFANSLEASQLNFDEPDYRISVRFNDDSLKTVAFDYLDEDDLYLAKNDERNVVYIVSSELIDQLFGLEFKAN